MAIVSTFPEKRGLNTDDINDIASGEINNGFVQSQFNYSTEEQVIGKWVDGKPLYQKTLVGTFNNDVFAQVGIPLAYAHIVSITAKGNNTPFQTLGRSGKLDNVWIRENGELCCTSSSTELTGATIYATVQYTKTTD